ncbi:uncharacterized protein LOC107848381 isoform X1 [Capsicum annuum]|uniref:uncharacterized protein LOC107848381 isoform X1 n=1 Tax=Capsicum annuum TaxID=4072 RepID=UPI0007BF29E1|nr:uncharacterized protein LOC107848381 isoform X1 [Capsicum annuum]
MARDGCLARVTAGVAVGGAVGGAVGACTSENQIYWANYFGKCSYFWSLLGCWKLDTLWEVLLSIYLLAVSNILIVVEHGIELLLSE